MNIENIDKANAFLKDIELLKGELHKTEEAIKVLGYGINGIKINYIALKPSFEKFASEVYIREDLVEEDIRNALLKYRQYLKERITKYEKRIEEL